MLHVHNRPFNISLYKYVLFSQFRLQDVLQGICLNCLFRKKLYIHTHVDARTWDNISKKQFSGLPPCGLIWENKIYKPKRSIGYTFKEWSQHSGSLLMVVIKLCIELHILFSKVIQTLLAFFLNENPLYHPKSMWNGIKQSRFTMKGTVQLTIVSTSKLADLSVTHQETFQLPLKENRETLLALEELHFVRALRASCPRNLQSTALSHWELFCDTLYKRKV